MAIPNPIEVAKLVKEHKSTFIFLLLVFVLLISYLSARGNSI